MKITCDTDIIEIERIKSNIDNIGERFINKIFTEKEINYCESKGENKYQHYAARFAAKEAAFKAFSWQLDSNANISWKDFEVSNDEFGNPSLTVLNSQIKNLESIDISLSHCKSHAIANVVVIFL